MAEAPVKNRIHITERVLHWISACLILYMLLNMGSMMHISDYTQLGTHEHRNQAISHHATIGTLLVVLLLIRIVWSHVFQRQITRLQINNKLHAWFIKGAHWLLYGALFSLAVSGLLMILNSDNTVNLFGFEYIGTSNYHGQEYGQFRDLHLTLISTVWWLIFFHFFGVMAARK